MYRNTKHNQHKEGFSLIEVIVSLGLFAVVMTIALGALFMVIAANRHAKAIKLVVNNVNVAIEGMTRELRVGSEYCADSFGVSCDDITNGGSQEIYFRTDTGQSARYWLDNSNPRGAIKREFDNGGAFNLTGSDVDITALNFYIQGTAKGDGIQPYVTVVVRGEIQVGDVTDDFQLQSTISQRKLAP